MRKLLIAIVLSSSITLLAPGLASASKKSDQTLSAKVTLQQSDVPDVFEELPIGDEDEAPFSYTCEGAIGTANDAALAAPHASSGYKLDESEGYAIINSEVAVLRNTAAAKKALDAYQGEAAAEACTHTLFAEFLTQPGLTTEVTVGSFSPELDDKGSKKVIKGGDEFVGFSVGARRVVEGGEPQFLEAIVVIGRVGRGTFHLTYITTGVVPVDDVQAMTQAVVKRLEPAR